VLAAAALALYNNHPHLGLIGAWPIITIGNLPGDRQAFAADLGTDANKPGMLTPLRAFPKPARLP
jgi:hypothetical protein